MRHITTSLSLALLLCLAGALVAGCGGDKVAVTAPDVPAEQLTNPDPGSGVDGSFIPYIPPPTDTPGSNPIPAFTDPGMNSQTGQNSDPSGLGEPVLSPNGNGMDLTMSVLIPTDGGLLVEVKGDDGKVRVFVSQGGSASLPIFTGDTPGPGYDPGTGQFVLPLQQVDGLNVLLTFTVLDGEGNATNTSHTIQLPPGWTPIDQFLGGNGQMF